MASSEDIALRIALKDEISSGLGNITGALGKIGLGFGAFELGRRVLTNIIGDTANLQGQMIDLREAVKRTGAEWGPAKLSIEAFTQRMEEQKGVIDDYTRGALQRAIDYTKDLGEAQNIVSMAADLAAAKHVDLESATNALGAAYTGNIRGLIGIAKEMKGVITESSTFADIQKALAYYQGAASAETAKLSVKWDILKDKIGDVNEAIGAYLGGAEESGGAWGSILTFLSNGFSGLADDLNKSSDGLALWWLSIKAGFGDTEALYEMNEKLRVSYQGIANDAKTMKLLPSHLSAGDQEELRKKLELIPPAIQLIEDEWLDAEAATFAAANAVSAYEQAFGKINLKTEIALAMPDPEDNLNEITNAMGEDLALREEAAYEAKLEAAQGYTKEVTEEHSKMYKTIVSGFTGSVRANVGAMLDGQMELAEVFKNMAKDFFKYFVQEVIAQVAEYLVIELLKILGGIFDTPANDRMAAQQGADFAKYFTQGVVGGLSGIGPTMTNALALPNQSQLYMQNAATPQGGYGGGQINVYVSGNMTSDFIQRNIVDTIQRAANNGFGGFKYNAGFTTGNSAVAFN